MSGGTWCLRIYATSLGGSYPGKALVNLVEKNTLIEVAETSRAAFSATTERLRIGALLALHGVGWPMASVILHFAFPECYPILDKRVMRVVGVPDAYSFDRWVEYTDLCREASRRLGVSMRVLDRALWTLDRTSTPDGYQGQAAWLSVEPYGNVAAGRLLKKASAGTRRRVAEGSAGLA